MAWRSRHDNIPAPARAASTKFSLSALVFDESLYALLSKSATTSVLAVRKFVMRFMGLAATVAACDGSLAPNPFDLWRDIDFNEL